MPYALAQDSVNFKLVALERSRGCWLSIREVSKRLAHTRLLKNDTQKGEPRQTEKEGGGRGCGGWDHTAFWYVFCQIMMASRSCRFGNMSDRVSGAFSVGSSS